MIIIALLFFALLTIPAIVAYWVSHAVHIRLQNEPNKHPKTISVVVFIACFVVTVAAIIFASSFIRFER